MGDVLAWAKTWGPADFAVVFLVTRPFVSAAISIVVYVCETLFTRLAEGAFSLGRGRTQSSTQQESEL